MNNKAFTLIELLVVISIIGVLSSIVLVSFSGSRDKARLAKAQNFDAQVSHALGAYAVGIWRFESISGGKVSDESGYGNDGTIHGAVPAPDGGVYAGTEALYFDGNDDYINCGNRYSLNITDTITIEAWVKSTKNNASLFQGIVSKANLSGSELGWILSKRTNNKFYFQVSLSTHARNDTTTYSDIAYTDNDWHHLVGVLLANGSHYLYIDGAQQSASYSGTSWRPAVQNIPLVIGTAYGDHPTHAGYNERFGGLIDNIAIYNEALSSAQIQQHYVAGAPAHGIAINNQ